MLTNFTILSPLTCLCLVEDLGGVQVALQDTNSPSNHKHLAILHCNAVLIGVDSRICLLRP